MSEGPVGPDRPRLRVLDGWRALSILMVLAGHMLPLGPASWETNAKVAALGMVVFFNLSGFLIVSMLLANPDAPAFLVKRMARILPLAWTVLAGLLLLIGTSAPVWSANLLFYANLPPFRLTDVASHFWSLCVEVQFYVGIATATALLGRRGVLLVLPIGVAVTTLRIATGVTISIVTWFRLDEVMAGGMLALLIASPLAAPVQSRLNAWLVLPLGIAFLCSTTPSLPWLNYFRPYISAALLGLTTLKGIPLLSKVLDSRLLGYIASISYAVYVFHHFFLFGWFAGSTKFQKYARRPLALALTFIIAHISTFKFERPFTDWAHRVTKRRQQRRRKVKPS